MSMDFRVLINDHLDAERRAVHKQYGNEEHQGGYGNADLIKIPMR